MERSERLNGDSEPKSIHESPEGNIRNMDKSFIKNLSRPAEQHPQTLFILVQI